MFTSISINLINYNFMIADLSRSLILFSAGVEQRSRMSVRERVSSFLVAEVTRLPHKPLWRFRWRCVWLQNIFSSPTAPPGGCPVPNSPPGSQITGIPRCSKLVKALRLKFMCSLWRSFKEHWRSNRSKRGPWIKKKKKEIPRIHKMLEVL